jgi:hypothetical protein
VTSRLARLPGRVDERVQSDAKRLGVVSHGEKADFKTGRRQVNAPLERGWDAGIASTRRTGVAVRGRNQKIDACWTTSIGSSARDNPARKSSQNRAVRSLSTRQPSIASILVKVATPARMPTGLALRVPA